MLSPLVSLVLLFGQHGKAVASTSVTLHNPGNRRVAPAENPQPHPLELADTDGTGGKGGGGPSPTKPVKPIAS
jgi:hypothetical protein